MNVFSAFLPLDRRAALTAGQQLPDRVQGAALFADISGFTALTAVLRHELGARRGAEEVVGHVNRVYTALIDQVHRFQGDVIGFSGDAATCWFDDAAGPESEGPPAAERAVGCALALQAAMTSLRAITTAAGTVIPLKIKVAVAAGPARRFLVGDPTAYVLEVLAGATLDRMAAAEALAEPGEILIAADMLPLLDAPVILGRRESDGEKFILIGGANVAAPPPRPQPPDVDVETARPWLLPPVADHLSQGAAEFFAELRPSVALFVRFGGIDYDDDDAGIKLHAFICRVQGILARYEGYLLQATMGDKGSYLYISFGAPIAHEDDTVRAAAAALEMRDLAQALGFLGPLQIGISSGLVYSGAYGSPHRRTYGVMGNEVNISARLMSVAQPGQILVSPRVASIIGRDFTLDSLPPFHLKGIDEAFTPFWLLGRQSTGRAVAPTPTAATMVGRITERAQLDAALLELAAGRSAAVLIEGPAGIGKTRLLRELLNRAQTLLPQAIVLETHGDAVERSTPYFVWRPVFERLTDPAASNGHKAAQWREAVLAGLSPAAQSMAPLLNAVLPLDLPENELTEALTGEARQENTFQLLLDMLRRAVGSAPLVLALDDAQWIDSVSWTLLGRLWRESGPENGPLLLALGARVLGDDGASVSAEAPAFTGATTYAELKTQPATRRISLDVLAPSEVEALISRRLGVAELPPAVLALIHDKAEGHPFFSEELAYALRDTGLLIIENGRARLAAGADLAALTFPNTIQGVITSRIDRLTPQQQLTVKVASVIGRIFAYRVLTGVYPADVDKARLDDSLTRLAQLELTPLESPEPNLAYVFKHLVTQEVVYSLMTEAQQQELHRRIARWYEKTMEGDLERHYAVLAHHWRLAGDPARAIDYYSGAGENAFRDYANQEAIRYFERALELAGPQIHPLRRARWLRLMGEARYRMTQIDSSVSDYEAALATLGRPMPATAARRGLSVGRELARQMTHRLLPGLLVGRAARRPNRAAELLESARAHEGVAEIYYNLGDFLSSFYCILTSFNMAESAGPSPELMRGYANMCPTFGAVNMRRLADHYRRLAVATAADVADPPALAWMQISLSNYSLWIGEWDRAEQEVGIALDLYSRLGEWRRWCVAAWVWPQIAQGKGELRRARELWGELITVAVRSNDTRHQVRGQGGQFFNYLALGETAAALACRDAVAVIMADNPEMTVVEERLWHGMNAVAALHHGDYKRAGACAREQLAAIGRNRLKFDLLEVLATPAEVLTELWEKGEATQPEAEQGCKAMDSYARTYAFGRPRALRLRGRCAWLAGQPNKAARLWRDSLNQAKVLSMPYERALTLREIGRRAGDGAAIAEAEQLLRDLGCELPAIPL